MSKPKGKAMTKMNFKQTLIWSVAIIFIATSSVSSHAQDLPNLELAQNTASEPLDINDVLQEIEQELPSETLSPTPTASPTPPPQDTQLQEPQAANDRAAQEQAENLPQIPTLDDAAGNDGDGLFYDAEQNIPRSEIGRKSAPRRVSPADEPGTKIIVVKKNFDSSSRKAEMVAAERAMKLGRYAAALEMYDAMYAKNKRDPNVLMGRAEAYQRLGQDDFAVEAYEELLDNYPNSVEARVNMLGIIGQRFPAVALRQLIDLRKKHTDNVGIVAQIAVTKAALGEYQDAIRFLGIAASLEPQNATHIFNMAVVADKAGERNQAIQFYEQALQADTVYGKGQGIPREAIFERLASLR
ncbi:MAG: tetratricopeptide repeat protein [Bdellovibrionales bacterium]